VPPRRLVSTLCLVLLAAPPVLAWDCHGHRAITLLAIDGLVEIAPDAPAFLKDEQSRWMAASNSCQPDRYRSIRIGYMAHENNPEHYLDVDKLPQFGLTLETMPPLRYEYLRAMIVAKHEHPDNVDPYNPMMDPTRHTEWPGYGAHAVVEHYVKLVAEFKTWRTLDRLNDPSRGPQAAAARANVLMQMGHLSHFVGDLAQPLHTTTHHHGWKGDNPGGFTTEYKFHSYIDGDILVTHQFDRDSLRPLCTFDRRVDAADPWKDAIEHIRRSHDQVVPLYQMQKSGELEQEAGKKLIAERLCDGGRTLAAMYAAAWSASTIDDKDVREFINYDRWEVVSKMKKSGPLPRGLQPDKGGAEPPPPSPVAPTPAESGAAPAEKP